MKLYPEQLEARLGQQLPPVILLSGDEPLQMLELADRLRQLAVQQGYSERIVLETQRNFDWNQLADEQANRSLFGDRRLFDLRLHSTSIGNEGSKALSDWCKAPAEESLLLISAPKLDKKQLATKWVKAVDACGYLVQIWPIELRQLPGWLEQRMRSRGLQPQRGVAALLAERVEGNLLAATQEIEKLLLLQGPGPVSQDALLQGVSDSARYDVFGLVDEILAGRAARCLRILSGLHAEGEAETLVLWALARELRSLYPMARQVRGGEGIAAVVDAQRVWPKRKPLVSAALKRLGPGGIRRALVACSEIDAAIKGRRKQDPWLLLEQLCLALCGVDLGIRAA